LITLVSTGLIDASSIFLPVTRTQMTDTILAQTGSPLSAVAQRYALSLYELAAETKSVAAVEKDLGRFETLINGSADLKRLINSPVFSAEDQLNAVKALAAKAKISGIVANFLKVVASNRRLFALPAMITGFRQIAADKRGQASADVTTAHKLSPQQEKELAATLKSVVGKDVSLKVTVDPSLLGGLVVRVGSRQIDTSLKTKLASLKLALKEVG
jgi:F-type H+-transporting ATPase subunit delta